MESTPTYDTENALDHDVMMPMAISTTTSRRRGWNRRRLHDAENDLDGDIATP